MKFDRRVIYLFVVIAIALPIIFPLNLKVKTTKEVLGVYDPIEKLPEGSKVLLVYDYEPSSGPELDPMASAVLSHCFEKNLRVVGMCMWINTGAAIAEKNMNQVAKMYKKVNGTDYVNLGYKSGGYAVVLGMGDNIRETYPMDYHRRKLDELPVMKGINQLRDFDYIVVIHDDSSVFSWINYGYERYPDRVRIGTGCTAVMATGNYPPLQAKQITGIIGGLKGASEYEKLIDYKQRHGKSGPATAGMDSQSVIHIFIILLIVLGNIMYFTVDKKKRNND